MSVPRTMVNRLRAAVNALTKRFTLEARADASRYMSKSDALIFSLSSLCVAREKIHFRRRVDVDECRTMVRSSQPYSFGISESGPVVGLERSEIRRWGLIGQSHGGRALVLRNSTFTSAQDVIFHKAGATLAHLDRQNEELLELYSSERLTAGWTKGHLLTKAPKYWVAQYPKTGLVLFSSYSEQWGHFVGDLLFRMLDLPDLSGLEALFVDDRTPPSAETILRELCPSLTIVRVPSNHSIRLRKAIFPLPRTAVPPGFRPEIDPLENACAWAFDGPAVHRLRASLLRPSGKVRYRRIFLVRKQANIAFENRLEVEEFLHRAGFQFVAVEQWALLDLLDLLSEAEIVVTGTGSNVTNLFFVDPGLRVVRLANPSDNPAAYSSALAYAGHISVTLICQFARPIGLTPYERKQGKVWVSITELNRAITLALGLSEPRPATVEGHNQE